MCICCKNIKDLSKTVPLISHKHKMVVYLFGRRLFFEETKSTRKYSVGIYFCPICGRNLTEEENAVEMKPVIHAHAIIDWLGNCKCSNCGNIDLNSTEPYCQHCGATLDEPEEREE